MSDRRNAAFVPEITVNGMSGEPGAAASLFWPQRPHPHEMLTLLASYDWIVVSSSAGKDSQAMLDYVCELATAAKVRERVLVLHCDLGRVEWQGTRELAERQARRYDVQFMTVVRLEGKTDVKTLSSQMAGFGIGGAGSVRPARLR
jgi:3'-phosphoadenosine 5'-phosphosulfate sulfotransferase (PAPS reductase)/FAD synthetase